MPDTNKRTESSSRMDDRGFTRLPGPRFVMRDNEFLLESRKVVVKAQYLQAASGASESKNMGYVLACIHTVSLWFLIVSPALQHQPWSGWSVLLYLLVAGATCFLLLGVCIQLAVPSPRFNRQTQRVYFKYEGHYLALPWARVSPYARPYKKNKPGFVHLYLFWSDWRSLIRDPAIVRDCEPAVAKSGMAPHLADPFSVGRMSIAEQMGLFDRVRGYMAGGLNDFPLFASDFLNKSKNRDGLSIMRGIVFLLKALVYVGAIGPVLQLIFFLRERKARWPDWIERDCLADPAAMAGGVDSLVPHCRVVYRRADKKAGKDGFVFIDVRNVPFDRHRARRWLITTMERYIEQTRATANGETITEAPARRWSSSPSAPRGRTDPEPDAAIGGFERDNVSTAKASAQDPSSSWKETSVSSDRGPDAEPESRPSFFDNLDEKYGTPKR